MTLEYEISEAAQERAEKLAVGMVMNMVIEAAQDIRLEAVRNLIQDGVSIDLIAKSLGLSMEQLTQLKENL